MQPWRGDRFGPVHFRAPPAPSISPSAAGDRRAECSPSGTSRAGLAIGLAASFALLPLAWAQGSAARRRIPRLPSASPPHRGEVSGLGAPIRVLAIGESSISGVGVSCSAQSMTAVAARTLARRTGRPASWRVHGFSGATARQAMKQLMPRIAREPADLVIIAFGVNDATSYRSPNAFADDLAALVAGARQRVGEAAVVIAGVAPLTSFPALPWPLRAILGWRSAALQAAADRLAARLPKLAVERFAAPPGLELFAQDGFHPNPRAHALWGEKIAALALPLVA
jgi:lysophospholipase L1-like esterase